tara:strand:- start:48 stop:575 length:528 start_codon:yes stop_codon:yes gene_type:complete
MRLSHIHEDLSKWHLSLDPELHAFPIWDNLREFMLANPQKVRIDRSEPITAHEIKVGGAKTNGKHKGRSLTDCNWMVDRNIIIVTMPRSDIKPDQFASKNNVTADDLWNLLTEAVKIGYASPTPPDYDSGNNFSVFRNITNITDNSITFIFSCWLPDFKYLKKLKAAGKTKYPAQ